MRNLTKKIVAATLLAIGMATPVFAQLEMGGWQTHLSYKGVKQIVQTPNKIYAVSNGSLFSVDKEYNSLETYSKVTGLSDGDIRQIAYDAKNDILVVCYSSFVIDIIEDGEIFKMTDIANKEISGKVINNISFGDKYIYISCGFGIVAIDRQKKEIAGTYIVGMNGNYEPIIQTQESEDSVYAIGSMFLYSASKKDNNLGNHEHWTRNQLPNNCEPTTLSYFGGKINVFGNAWYQWEKAYGWNTMPYTYIQSVNKVHTSKDKISVVSTSKAFSAIFNDKFEQDTVISAVVNDMLYDPERNTIWHALDSLKSISRTTGAINSYCPEGPATNLVSFMKYDGGQIVSGYGVGFGEPGVIQQYKNGEWTNFVRDDIKNNEGRAEFFSIWDAAYDPKDNKRLYVATWRGLYEFYDNIYQTHYNKTNSSLQECITVDGITATERVEFDKDGNLWVLDGLTSDLIHCRDTEGNWHNLRCPSVSEMSTASDFIITKKHNLKVLTSSKMNANGGSCIFFLKSGSKPHIIDKQKIFKNFTINDGTKVSPTRMYCVAEDLNGDLWVGTDLGPFVMKNISNVFSDNYITTRIKLTRKDDATLADYLLSTETINTIAVDGGNRKWIGTLSSGVYVLSADGQETIHHFTTENSPLNNNSITKIAIDSQTGMVYISTPGGLFSYKNDAAAGKENFNDVHVYPNPVKPDYSGLVTITGLMEDTEVRITDAQGNVVCHGKSNGSIFTWDCQLTNGRRASTGVYYVYQATKDGNNDNVAKFAIIKR